MWGEKEICACGDGVKWWDTKEKESVQIPVKMVVFEKVQKLSNESKKRN